MLGPHASPAPPTVPGPHAGSDPCSPWSCARLRSFGSVLPPFSCRSLIPWLMALRESPVARETAEIPPHPIATASASRYQPPRPFIEFPGHQVESALDPCFFLHASQSITPRYPISFCDCYFLTTPKQRDSRLKRACQVAHARPGSGSTSP